MSSFLPCLPFPNTEAATDCLPAIPAPTHLSFSLSLLIFSSTFSSTGILVSIILTLGTSYDACNALMAGLTSSRPRRKVNRGLAQDSRSHQGPHFTVSGWQCPKVLVFRLSCVNCPRQLYLIFKSNDHLDRVRGFTQKMFAPPSSLPNVHPRISSSSAVRRRFETIG